MDNLSRAGFDVWALDFAGYGESSRYPEMSLPADAHGPLGTADACAEQLAAAVEFIAGHEHVERISIIAHSWGTLVAGLYANRHSDRIARLVLFGPIAARHQTATPAPGAWWDVTADYQWTRFQAEVPKGDSPVFPRARFDSWMAAYVATDSTGASRRPPSVRVPAGAI